jgi:hypothetical protein
MPELAATGTVRGMDTPLPEHRYVGENNGIAAACFSTFMGLSALLLWAVAPATTTGQTVLMFVGVFAACLLPIIGWVGFRLQDIVAVDPAAHALTVLQRRLLLPNSLYTYAGADVRGVDLRKLMGEDQDTYIAHVQMTDGRKFALGRDRAEQAVVEAEARGLLVALGRGDLHPRYPTPKWPT